jgi:hypothetical protein
MARREKPKDLSSLERKIAEFSDIFDSRKHRKGKVVRGHKPLTAKCVRCYVDHNPSDHKSHGRGSFARTRKKRKKK